MATFNLIAQPWIPVLREDGTTAELGLRDALVRAHEWQAIRDPLPTVEFGLYRLLVACILDIFAPEDALALTELLRKGLFSPDQVDAYFARWADRFDLFHSRYPFLQTAGMEDHAPKPLAGLLHPMPSGTNAAHFHHGHEDDFGISPAAVARLLTTIAPFMTAGGAGLSPSINGAPPWYALIQGETLFHTLCLNTYVLDLSLARTEDDFPAWRDDRPLAAGRCTNAGLRESLTWRPRRIQLVPGAAGMCALTHQESPVLIRTMKFAPGAACDFSWRDPSVPYKMDDKGAKVMRPQEGKEVWRDTGPLALLREGEHGREDAKVSFARPLLIDQFASLVTNGYIRDDTPLNLTLYGMRTDMKMKIFEWQRETLRLPMPLILQDRFHREAYDEMKRAGSVAYSLQQAIKKTYPRDGKGNKGAFDSLIHHAERQFWAALRTPYDDFLNALGALNAEQEWEIAANRVQWQTQLKAIGNHVLEEAIGRLDTDAKALHAQIVAQDSFRKALFNLFATEEEKQARAERKKAKKGAVTV